MARVKVKGLLLFACHFKNSIFKTHKSRLKKVDCIQIPSLTKLKYIKPKIDDDATPSFELQLSCKQSLLIG